MTVRIDSSLKSPSGALASFTSKKVMRALGLDGDVQVSLCTERTAQGKRFSSKITASHQGARLFAQASDDDPYGAVHRAIRKFKRLAVKRRLKHQRTLKGVSLKHAEFDVSDD